MRYSLETLKDKKNLIGAEIGVARGRNAESIFRNLDIQKLYLIDPYAKYTTISHIGVPTDVLLLKKKAYHILSRYSDRIVWIHEMSDKAYRQIKDILDFVYIDANHTYEYVKTDMTIYRDMVKDGGLVAGHDYGGEVKRAVDELAPKDKLSTKGHDWWYTK